MIRLEQLLVSVLVLAMLAAGSWFGVQHYGVARYDAGHAAAIAERAEADATAVLTRTAENKAKTTLQAQANTNITKEKDDEIADLRRRLAAAPRLRVGPAVCPDRPAATANAESAAGGDGADPSAGLVSTAADRDLKQLISDVEADLATGRACQRFLKENDLVP